jgi:hypothetical protein
MRNISKTIKAAWEHPLAVIAPGVAVMIVSINTPEVWPWVGWVVGGFIKAIAVVGFMIFTIDLRYSKGRGFGVNMAGAFLTGAILAAPFFMPSSFFVPPGGWQM